MANSQKWAWVPSVAKKLDLDPEIIKAFAEVESNGNHLAVRFEPRWRYFVTPEKFAKQHLITVDTEKVLQAMSWGPLQLMGGKARELGFDGMLTELVDPNISGYYSCLFLKKLIDKWTSIDLVAASYNAGTPLIDPETKQFRNQEYVDKIKSKLGG